MRFFHLAAALALATAWPRNVCAGADEFIAGIGTHITSNQGLSLIHEAGISWLRDDIHWDQIERERGVFVMPERYERYVNEALRRGIKPLLILCYGNKLYDNGGYPVSDEALEAYARFAEFVVTHFKDRVQLFEIWNEWNYGIGMPPRTPPGEPGAYVALLRKVYPRLKGIDPNITVIGGVLSGNGVESGWLESACKAGLLEHLDALSYHPYCYGETGDERTPENGLMKRIRGSREVMRRYQQRDLPVFLTEIGWPNHTGKSGSTLEDSARFLARSFLLARTQPFIRGVWWYDFRDDGARDPSDPEHNFGIVTNNLTPKPAFHAMREICRLFRETKFTGEVEANSSVRILKFQRESGEILFAMWSVDSEEWEVVLESARAEKAPPAARVVQIGRPEIAREWEPHEDLWRLPVTLSGMPCVVETGLVPVEPTWHRLKQKTDNATGAH
jgi:Glycosyl hydrolase family 1